MRQQLFRIWTKGIHVCIAVITACCALYCSAEDVLVVRPDEMNFKNALDGLKAEIDFEFSIFDYIIDKNTTVRDFDEVFHAKSPKMVVLMEGKSLHLYGKWQGERPAGYTFPPSLVLMTVFAEERIRSLENAVGIKYEIQAVHSVSSLRSVLAQPVDKVGVLYSTNLRVFFANQKAQCEKEKIELVGVMIDEHRRALESVIKNELTSLLRDPEIDAIWILPDNVILKDVLLEWGWVPRLKKAKKPVIVSVERLLSQLKLGHFAVVPDHYEMGTQAARWILQISENNWATDPSEPRIRSAYSARKKLDSSIIPKGVKLNKTVMAEEWADFGTK